MMARITNDQQQGIQSRLFKRAHRGLEKVEEGDDIARSLKSDSGSADANRKYASDKKPASPPALAKAPSKEGTTDLQETSENKSSAKKPAQPTPVNAPSKEDVTSRHNKAYETMKPVNSSGAKTSSYAEEEKDFSEFSSTSSDSSSSSSSSTQGKSGKSGRGTCDKPLQNAFDQVVKYPDVFPEIESPSDVTQLCSFFPISAPNFGCPFFYIPEIFGFVESEEINQILFDDLSLGSAFWSLQLYCQCYQAFDLGCSTKIPHGPPSSVNVYAIGDKFVNSYSEFIPAGSVEKRLDYCEMVGVWNGDFDTSLFLELSPDVRDCGCFFIGTAQDMVGTCPGVDLGAYFPIPIAAEGEESIPSDEIADLFMEERKNVTYFPTISPSDE